ncbi:hypothetical protein QOZ80_1AG0003080 [Eleusine coracana subsp. coracana]|nr:hypothetical protein QOZ80_1AG0003080 [Eleusine coracana subsp. coracana]
MASPSMEAAHPPTTIRDLIIGRVDYFDDDIIAEEGEEEEEDDDEWDDMSKRMSRLSMEGSDGGDADDENDGGDVEEDNDEFDEVRSDIDGATPYRPAVPSSASLPGTPDRAAQAASQSSPWWPGPSSKEYASETEARWPPAGTGRRRHHHRRERMMREVWLERAWRMRKQRRQMMQGQVVGEVPVVVLGGGAGGEGSSSPSAVAAARGGVAMDMEEVRACRDLGLDLPGDWTVEIPCYALSGVDTASSGGNSPASGSWRISSPGDDPKDVKARLKVWAQAVALASASRLGGS